MTWKHGTAGGYSNHGCRCAECTEAKRAYNTMLRDRYRKNMPPRGYASLGEYNFVTLLEFIFHDDPLALMGLTRLVHYGNPEFVPYIPRDPRRRERLLTNLRIIRAAAAV